MDIKHSLGNDMEIALDPSDIEFIQQNGYCMDRCGLCGHDTKTWVRTDFPKDQPTAQIDGASDVTVYLPGEIVSCLPAYINNADIDPYMDPDRGRVEHFFGQSGGIVVKATENYFES